MRDLLVDPLDVAGHTDRPQARLQPARPDRAQPPLPLARGPVSTAIIERLRRPPGTAIRVPPPRDHSLWGEDSALALHVLYELHYRGFDGVDDEWEWDPALAAVRHVLEIGLEDALRTAVGGVMGRRWTSSQVVEALVGMAAGDQGPSLSRHLEAEGTITQMREFAVHRSIYQLKEADGHTWGIPRLFGDAKAALVEIQRGEYGNGDPARVHAELFRATMGHLGLDSRYGAYIDAVPSVTLATDNVVSYFGLHRRWRGALVGHLTHFEMCSVQPMTRYGSVLRRLGLPGSATAFFDEHVGADEHHAVVAVENLVCGLLRSEPDLAGQVIFGATVLNVVEGVFAEYLLESWASGSSSLRGDGAMRW